MYRYQIEFRSIEDNYSFVITTAVKNDLDEFVNFFFQIFGQIIVNDVPTIEVIQIKTVDIEKKILHLVDYYKNQIPQIQGLSAFFRKLKPNQYFAFIPNLKLNFEESLKIIDVLNAGQKGISYDKLPIKAIDYFGNILDQYKAYSFGSNRVFIGNKKNPTCRFCVGLSNPKKFKSKAHSISEALGNKTIFLFEECDFCNHKFSKTIEPDIIEYLSIYRSLFNIKGKGGTKKFKGKNFHLVNENNKLNIFLENYKNRPKEGSYNYNLELESNNKLVSQNIYKSLCKYFLSVIDSSELKNFKTTIDWINGSFEMKKLPIVAKSINTKGYINQPVLNYYLRINMRKDLPYAVAEFLFANLKFIYIIPMAKKDSKNFIWKKHYIHFWKSFNHLQHGKEFSFENFSSSEPRDFRINLNFSQDSI